MVGKTTRTKSFLIDITRENNKNTATVPSSSPNEQSVVASPYIVLDKLLREGTNAEAMHQLEQMYKLTDDELNGFSGFKKKSYFLKEDGRAYENAKDAILAATNKIIHLLGSPYGPVQPHRAPDLARFTIEANGIKGDLETQVVQDLPENYYKPDQGGMLVTFKRKNEDLSALVKYNGKVLFPYSKV